MKLRRIPLFDIAFVLLLMLLAFSHANAQAPAAAHTAYLPLVVASPPTYAEQVLQATNALRAQAGCKPLSIAPALMQAAQGHSAEMATHDFVSHTGLDGSSPQQRAQATGYAGLAGWENVAAGYPTAAAVVSGWQASPGHRANMLNCDLKEVGIGMAENEASDYGVYWTQAFGRP
jgi:uncharacterized protein YkwD